MSKQLRALLIKEEILRNRLEKLIENGQQAPLERRTRGFYEIKLEELKRVWAEYEPLDQSINEIIYQNPAPTPHKYITENNFGKLEAKYSDYIGEILEALHNTNTDITHINSTLLLPQTSQLEHEENVLPKIALPKYNGDYDGWRAFHDLFVALVHNNTRLKPVQKLFYLKTSLIGEAEKILRNIPITGDNYIPAWLKLKDRYENNRILTHHQLKKLTEQPKLATETSAGLKTLIDTSEECLQQLHSLHVDTSSWDILLIHLLVKKLPFVTLKAWEESQGATRELPTYKQFKLFLNTRLKILEAITDTLVSKPNQNNSTPKVTKTYHAKIEALKCPACDESHPLHKCHKYQGMDIKSRRKFISKLGCCYNCLSTKHRVKKCPSTFRCLQCKNKHHTSLHEDIKVQNQTHTFIGQNTNKISKNKGRNGYTNPNTGHSANLVQIHNREIHTKSNTGYNANTIQTCNRDTHTKSNSDNNTDSDQTYNKNAHTKQDSDQNVYTPQTQAYMIRDQSQVLLSTALVIAQGEYGQPKTLRCLLDSGSESSFITQNAFDKLKTTQSPTSITVVDAQG